MIGYAKKIEKIIRESAFDKKKKKPGLKFNLELALTGVRTTRPGAYFSKLGPVTLRARHQIFKSKYKE